MALKENASPDSFWRHDVLLERLTRAFVALNILDLVVTFFLLNHGGFRESNGIADYYLDRWGFAGMVWYKILSVMIVIVVTQIVARYRFRIARWILIFGCLVMGGVVLYSCYLYLTYQEPAADPLAWIGTWQWQNPLRL